MNKKLNSLILMMAWFGMVAPSLWAGVPESDLPELAASDRALDEFFPSPVSADDVESPDAADDEAEVIAIPVSAGIKIMNNDSEEDGDEISILPQWSPQIDDMPRVLGSFMAAPATWTGLAMLGYLLMIKRSTWLKRRQ